MNQKNETRENDQKINCVNNFSLLIKTDFKPYWYNYSIQMTVKTTIFRTFCNNIFISRTGIMNITQENI